MSSAKLIGQRPYSIRTRIKTALCLPQIIKEQGQRPYSIRTRIKTRLRNLSRGEYIVRDHIPLEQGLRHCAISVTYCKTYVRDHIPLEQGLRPSYLAVVIMPNPVRDHIPLEQGLRQSS